MKRRQFLKYAVSSGIGLCCYPHVANAQTNQYQGNFLLVLNAGGGWDTSLYIDPKTNISGEKIITNWSKDATAQTAGNIGFAPVVNNEAFFKKFNNRTLIVNGVDTQTNSHSTGINHTYSGRNSEGYPSLPVLFAATHAPNVPFATLSLGGFSKTSNIISSVRLRQGNSLLDLVDKNGNHFNGGYIRQQFETDLIFQAQMDSYAEIKSNQDKLLPRYIKSISEFERAQKLSPDLEPFLDVLPRDGQFESSVGVGTFESPAFTNAQLILLSFKAGVTASGSMDAGGFFDSHQDNDRQQYQLLEHLNDTIEYIWDYAEELNIADRLTVIVSSDFSRTPYYNSQNGKDHWPTNSYMVMRKGASWANKVIGKTDEAQNALAINPNSLELDSGSSGIIMSPGHIHKAFRAEFGILGNEYDQKFNFNLLEDVAIFG